VDGFEEATSLSGWVGWSLGCSDGLVEGEIDGAMLTDGLSLGAIEG